MVRSHSWLQAEIDVICNQPMSLAQKLQVNTEKPKIPPLKYAAVPYRADRLRSEVVTVCDCLQHLQAQQRGADANPLPRCECVTTGEEKHP